MTAASRDFTVAICTRNRPQQLARLRNQDEAGFPLLVVDQSDHPDQRLVALEQAGELRVVRDSAAICRARNAAAATSETAWVVYVDDDCTVEPGWSGALRTAPAGHADAAFLAGHVDGEENPDYEGLQLTTFPVTELTVQRGSRVAPWAIGFGVCMAVRRDWIERVGGWDERLGAGGTIFPAGDDMDFNFRLLVAGGTAVNVPEVRVVHEQWRTRQEFIPIKCGYARSCAAVAVKTVRQGSPRAGLRLWLRGAFGNLTRLASAARRRSLLRFRLGIGDTRGHWGRPAEGTGRALVSS